LVAINEVGCAVLTAPVSVTGSGCTIATNVPPDLGVSVDWAIASSGNVTTSKAGMQLAKDVTKRSRMVNSWLE